MSEFSFNSKIENINDYAETPKNGIRKEKDILEETQFIDFESIYRISETEKEIKDKIEMLRKQTKKSQRDTNSKIVKLHPIKEDFIPSSFSTNISCLIF